MSPRRDWTLYPRTLALSAGLAAALVHTLPVAGAVPPSIDPAPAVRESLISHAGLASPQRFGSDRGPGLITNEVIVLNPTGPIAPFVAQIQKHAKAAADQWSRFLATSSPRTITISVALDPTVTRGGGRSATTAFVAARAGYNIFEQGWAYEIRTGLDPNNASPDVEITFELSYLQNELWFDPAAVIDPRAQITPAGKTDAFSVFLHELGHALAFNGWMNWSTGQLPITAPTPGAYRSPFDELTDWSTGQPYFFGTQTRQEYGGLPVPLTQNNVFHFGNDPGVGDGSDLIPDLMNGVAFFRGVRYGVSRIDLALCKDIAVPIQYCRADIDLSGTVTVQDIFDFLGRWFAGDRIADFNADNAVTVQDIFDFLGRWFAGC